VEISASKLIQEFEEKFYEKQGTAHTSVYSLSREICFSTNIVP
jgi:hypothetical protein